jgi:uncharacterized protein (UPF0332 family)
VSPRSAELLERARQGVTSARVLVDAGQAATAVSAAYYAMLYAARAALSERDRTARSHGGIWAAFREEFVLAQALVAIAGRFVSEVERLAG